MKKIDHETVQRILDTAQIVDVVSDFVTLKRRGSGYIGLCPFHNERTPSFSVSPAKGICKCFSCGKGGSPVNFIMELEQLSFGEALRYLANKYNIEIPETELTEEEQQAENDRGAMFAVNEFAAKHFAHNLLDTDDGRAIGLSYFKQRGISERMIKRFGLGYALENRNDLYMTALRRGFNERYLVDTGLCIRNERGDVYDRFKGRVIYPVQTVSGKIVAFGGRTLRSDKNVAKYVNSPESLIYKKNLQLYGLYQAKQAIAKHNKCILVEGYMDVISMHQSGIENVVASSGTSLTEGQIRLIHRFTDNVTVVYDSDPAGIKASLRGIDMLLAEGLDIKVLLLPEGDDPDSFAQSHSAAEVEAYIAENETDFITFKTKILLEGTDNDPMARARVINDVVTSISVIPDSVARDAYIRECGRILGVGENVLNLQVAKFIAKRLENEAKERIKAKNRAELPAFRQDESSDDAAESTPNEISSDVVGIAQQSLEKGGAVSALQLKKLRSFERQVMRYLMKYGMMDFDAVDAEGSEFTIPVIEVISNELAVDDIDFSDADLRHVYEVCVALSQNTFAQDLDVAAAEAESVYQDALRAGREQISHEAADMATIQANELVMQEKAEQQRSEYIRAFKRQYLQKRLLSSEDDVVRRISNELVPDKYVLSKVHTKYATIEKEEDRLGDIIPRAIAEWKDAILGCRLDELKARIGGLDTTSDGYDSQLSALLHQAAEIIGLRKQFAVFMGERVISPR